MSIWLWLIPLILFLLLVGVLVWYLRRKKKIVGSKKQEEYNEVMNDFMLAEEMYEDTLKGGGEYGKPNPYEILWRIAKSKRSEFTGEGIGATSELPPLPELPQRRDVVQRPIDETVTDYQPESFEPARSHKRNIFRRRHPSSS